MGDGFQFLDIIFFAMVAVFLVMRLRSVLGRRTGTERRRDPFVARPAEETGESKVIALPDRARPAAKAGQPAAAAEAPAPEAGLQRIAAADKSFDREHFASGVRAAFEIVLGAFAAGDTAVLRPLLSDPVYDDFLGAIRERTKTKRTRQSTLVGIKSVDILEAEVRGRTAVITVTIVSDQINVTRDVDGNVVEGDPSRVMTVTDIWTFARDLRSRDPNWTLVATRSPN